ncbi:hypothetical protein H1R20_g10114, partial [Candolleomyces eurysporus]
MLDHNWYNNLLTIKEANNAFTEREQTFKKIAPLLARPEFKGRYNLCLVHRHLILEAGERMVATGLVTQAETVPNPTPSDIIPSAWTATGVPFEWKRVEAPEDIIAPPPADLFREFSETVGEGIVLGLSLARDSVPEGQVWSERTDYERRQHILEMKPVEGHSGDDLNSHSTTWMITPSSDGQAVPTLVQGCKCTARFH